MDMYAWDPGSTAKLYKVNGELKLCELIETDK